MKIYAFIPARMESKRLPNKIIKKIFGIPMIEHVIKRVNFSNSFDRLVVVSNSKKLKRIIKVKNYDLVLSKKKHTSGTSRVSEISKKYKYNLATIIFADEPFIDPKKINIIINKLKKIKNYDLINVVTNLNKNDISAKEIVKCSIDRKKYIKDYFREKKNNDIFKIYKSSGILIFKKKILDNFKALKVSQKEISEKIEQFRFLENNLKIKSIFIPNIYPSINTKKEFEKIIKLIKSKPKELSFINKLNRV